MTQTIQQQRAAYALQRVKALQSQLAQKAQKEFTSYASNLPAMIHMNGLGQAMAFCKAKGKRKEADKIDTRSGVEAYRALFELVSGWLCRQDQPYAGKDDVLDGITQSDMAHYQLAQAEALVLMSWVKKFAKAFLAEETA